MATSHKSERRMSESAVYDDGTNTFFWRAHTITVLLIGILTLAWVALFEEQPEDSSYNISRGISAAIVVFLAFGITQAKDGPFVRPHPAFWRLTLCISVVYELLLVFFLFQTVSDARVLLSSVDPSLNKPLDFRAYGGSCTVWDPDHPDGPFHNVFDKLDGFVIAHILGWFFKALILRDVWITNIVSILFELLEYTFEHQLPNFSECWWDHWILDFILCNGLGIYVGLKCLKYLSAKEYKWHGLWNITSYGGKMRRMVSQFTPYSWVQFRWQPTENFFRWLFVSMLTLLFLVAELNTFYLKFVLWIPPEHPFVLTRLVLYVPWGAVAVREAYDYAGGTAAKFGQQAWIICAIIITEFMIVVKFGSEVLTKPFPRFITMFWLFVMVSYLCYSIWKFQMKFPRVHSWFKAISWDLNRETGSTYSSCVKNLVWGKLAQVDETSPNYDAHSDKQK